MIQDLVYGLRWLRKNPGFTLLSVLMLAVGIGVNTAMFSVIQCGVIAAAAVSRSRSHRVDGGVGARSRESLGLVSELR